MSGYISLHRQIRHNWLWPQNRPYTETEAWVDLLFRAAFKPHKQRSDNRLIFIEVGELLFSVQGFSKDWGWSRKRVKGFLDRLTCEDMISTSDVTRYDSRLRINNYAAFQGKNEASGTHESTPDVAHDVTPDVAAWEHMISSQPSQAADFSTPIIRNNKYKYIVEDFETAEWIFSKLKEMNPKHRQPDLKSWANTIRLMREQDERTDQEIRNLFTWANQDSFWRTVVLSPGKLREKWDVLVIKKTNGRSSQSMNSVSNGAIIV